MAIRYATLPEFIQNVRAHPENKDVTDEQIRSVWLEKVYQPQIAEQMKQRESDENRDSAFDYSVDNAQKILGAGVRTVGQATGIQAIEDFGQRVVDQQDRDIEEGGYQPHYQGSFSDAYNNGGIGDALGWAAEKAVENSVYSGGALLGGALAAATAPISAPAAALIGGGTALASGLGIAGETAMEMEDKGVEVQPGKALLTGVAGSLLERFGLGRMFPKGIGGKAIEEVPAQTVIDELVKRGQTGIAREIATETVKRSAAEAGTEIAQEGLIVGSAASAGAEYNRDELFDRAIDTAVLGGTIGAPVAFGSSSFDAVTQRPTIQQRIDELKARQRNADDTNQAVDEVRRQVREAVTDNGGDSLDQQMAESEIGRALSPEVIEANRLARESEEGLNADLEEVRRQAEKAREEIIKRTRPYQPDSSLTEAGTLSDDISIFPESDQRQEDKSLNQDAVTGQRSLNDSLTFDDGSGIPDSEKLILARDKYDRAMKRGDEPSAQYYQGLMNEYSARISRSSISSSDVSDTDVVNINETDDSAGIFVPEEVEPSVNNTQVTESVTEPKSEESSFAPTHELPNGEPVQLISENTYVDAAGNTWEISNVKPIKADNVDADTTPSNQEQSESAITNTVVEPVPTAEESTFIPTHEMPSGELVQAVEGESNVYVDADGFEWEEPNARPINQAQAEPKPVNTGTVTNDGGELSEQPSTQLPEQHGGGGAVSGEAPLSNDVDTQATSQQEVNGIDTKTTNGSPLSNGTDITPEQPVSNVIDESSESTIRDARLPQDIARATPRYNYGGKGFVLDFESDIDRASYIAAQTQPSKRDADYVAFVSEHTGMDESEVRAYGTKVRESIKAQAKDSEPGKLRIDYQGGGASVSGQSQQSTPPSITNNTSEASSEDKIEELKEQRGKSKDNEGQAEQGDGEGRAKPSDESGNRHSFVEPEQLAGEQDTNPQSQINLNDTPSNNSSANIQDFGEKLEGARKDFYSKMEAAKEKDVASVPLSESWPEPNYQKMIDSGVPAKTVGVIHALRDEIPSKPKTSWKLKGWTEQVSVMRDLAELMMRNSDVADTFTNEVLESRAYGAMSGRAELYAEVGHFKSLKGISFSQEHYSLFEGEHDVTKWVISRKSSASAFSNMPTRMVATDTKEEAIAQFKALYGNLESGPSKKVRFDIYIDRATKKAFIGKKIGSNVVRIKEGFDEASDARQYRNDNQAELEDTLKRLKEVPAHRNATNAPRVGIDHRSGGNVTPEQFSEAFGFRGVQFGNWVAGDARQQNLNEAYDALMDLAGILNVPAKALSLNGELGLAFGSRGKGGKNAAKAHYEPDNIVINLTKKNGAGSLAHEWWHALDNYFSRSRGDSVGGGYATEGSAHISTRPEVMKAFRRISGVVNNAQLRHRSSKLDQTRTKPYWSTGREMTARAFESYVIEKMKDQGLSNDYLANIVSEEYWDAAAKLGIEKSSTYPYPEAAEIPEIRAAYDAFFDVVEHRETDSGVELYSKKQNTSNDSDNTLTVEQSEEILNKDIRLGRAIRTGKLKLIQSLDEIPSDAKLYRDDFLYSRSQQTKEAYEQRIDELFEGGKPNYKGVKVLDRTDILDLLGHGEGPLHLVESAVGKRRQSGEVAHPEMTAEQWKRVPDWIENPAAVFKSATVDGRLTLIAPETVQGKPILIVLNPNGNMAGMTAHVLVNAYEKDNPAGVPVGRWVNLDKSLLYLDEKTSPEVRERSGLRLPGEVRQLRGYRDKVLTDADLVNYHNSKNQTSNAETGAIQGAYKDGIAYVIAGGNTEESLKQTAWHELTHAALDTKGDTFINPEQKEKLFKRLDVLVRLGRNSGKDTPLKRAIKRVEDAGTTEQNYLEEVAAYLVTDHVKDPDSLTGTVKKWVQDFLGAIQAAVLRYAGIQLGRVTGAELNAIAKAYADYVTKPNNGRETASDITLASREGYEGNDRGESREWLQAVQKGLDMSYEARMERAVEQGYIVSLDDAITGDYRDGKITHRKNERNEIVRGDDATNGKGNPAIYYHGTGADVRSFQIGHSERYDNGWLGEGIYLAKSRDMANVYADKKSERHEGNSNVLSLMIRPESLLSVPPSFKKVLKNSTKEQSKIMTERLLSEGFDGVVVNYNNTEAEVVVFDPSKIRSINAAFDPDHIDSSNLLLSRSSINNGSFSAPEDTLVSRIVTKMQDKFKVLKDLQINIEKAGGTVNEQNDAYLAEERFHGMAENDIRLMREQFVEPLAKKMADFGIKQKELDEYLYARHAHERNAQIAKINPDMPDGGSGMTNAEADAVLRKVENSGKQDKFEQAAQIVYDMLADTRDMIRHSGLETNDVLDSWESSYQFYVPLKGFDGETEGEGIPTTGSGFNIRGRESQRAMGRSSTAASPLSFAINDTTRAIIRKRKNEVGNALLKLIEDNPNKNYWQVFTDDNPETDRRIVKVKDPRTGEMVDEVRETAIPMAIMPDRYFQTKRDGVTYYMKLEDPRLMTAMKNLGPESNGALIRTLASINRVLSALNTSYSPEFVISNFSRDLQTALLNLQAEQTADQGKAAGEEITQKTIKDVPVAMRAIYRSLRGKAAKGGAAKWQTYFDEFRADGAKTGYFDMKDLDGQTKDVERLISMAQGGFKGNVYKYAKASMDFVEHINQAVENAVRLSAYVNARDAGISRAKAASLAKNMTVNFNRRGEISTTLNALYMFANASVQGTANFVRTMGMLKHPGGGLTWSNLTNAQKIAVGIAAGTFFLGMANRVAAGEDDDGENWYDKIPDYVKERNIVIMKSMFGGESGEYWKIPLPYGYNVFSVLGSGVESLLNGNKSVTEAGTELALATLGSFSPIGFTDSNTVSGLMLKNAAPTIIKPVVEIGLNENFMGSSIYNENFPFGTPLPDSSLSRRSTPEQYKRVAEWLNEVTGGSHYRSGAIDINPDVMQYVIGYFGGSAYNFFGTKSPDSIVRILSGADIEAHRVPFISRVTGKVLPYEDQSKFYTRRDEINQIYDERKSLSGEPLKQFISENSGYLKLRSLLRTSEHQLKALRKQRDAIYAENLPIKERDARLKIVESRMKAVIDKFNAAYGRVER